jgi:Ribonuclease G/E
VAAAQIRGIFTTALTKILLENGFEIVNPSATIKERFNLKSTNQIFDLKIKDRYDRQGVRVSGTKSSIDAFKSILQSNLDDVIIRQLPYSLDGIYKGLILQEDMEANAYLVNIGSAIGFLPKDEIPKHETNNIVVQVERKRIGAKNPILTTKIKFPGKYAILIPEPQVKISLQIRDLTKRAHLYALGKQLATDKWGIIWRGTAQNQPSEVLNKEVQELIKKAEEIVKKAEKAETPSLLKDGVNCLDIEFPALSKKQLDAARASVAPTIEGHHFYKACQGKVSSALEMAETMLEKGVSKEEVTKLLKTAIEAEFPTEDSQIDMEHVKLSGKTFYLGKAQIEKFDGHFLQFRRTFTKPGVYDGLDLPKEIGDYAITETEIGEWWLKTKYFSHNDQHKGTYINLNTPVELYPYGIRYVDLEVDIIVLSDGSIKTVDMEKLERALNKGVVTERLVSIVKEKMREITNYLV